METNAEYLEKELKKFQEIINQNWAKQKEEMKTPQDEAIIKDIATAELEMETDKNFYVRLYNQRINDLEREERAREIPSFTLDKESREQYYQREFRRQMNYSIDTWFKYVDIRKKEAELIK
ncbi:MAG: hypothetical protein WAV23_01980 [Minisyncoccia bacterium]